MVHESFEAGKCQPAFIVVGIQHNIPTVNTAQAFQIRAYVPKISAPKDTPWVQITGCHTLKGILHIHPRRESSNQWKKQQKKRENLKFSQMILPTLGPKTAQVTSNI